MRGSQGRAVRLIVTDLDGCLLDPGGNMPGDFDGTVDACERNGILLCACSGRSVEGVTHPLGRAADRMALITDNGARIRVNGRDHIGRPIPRELWRRVIDEGRKHPGLVLRQRQKHCGGIRQGVFLGAAHHQFRGDGDRENHWLDRQAPAIH